MILFFWYLTQRDITSYWTRTSLILNHLHNDNCFAFVGARASWADFVQWRLSERSTGGVKYGCTYHDIPSQISRLRFFELVYGHTHFATIAKCTRSDYIFFQTYWCGHYIYD